jgi:hypothetical protein
MTKDVAHLLMYLFAIYTLSRKLSVKSICLSSN